MAQKYRKVDPRMWDDEKFIELIPREKLVAVHAITSPQSNRCGLYRFSPALAAEQTGIDSDSYRIAFAKVCNTLRWKYDERRKVLFIPSWWKYNKPENPKHLKGCLEDLHEVPQTHLLKEFAENTTHLPPHCISDFSIAMGIAMGVGMPYQEQEQEQEQDSKDERAAHASTEPVERASAAAAAPQPAAKKPKIEDGDDSPVVLVFPTVGGKRSDDREWQLRQSFVTELSEAFPNLDVVLTCRQALSKVRAKPSLRKTAGGMKSFLWSWMKREVDGGRARAGPASQPPMFQSHEDPMTQARRVAAQIREGAA